MLSLSAKNGQIESTLRVERRGSSSEVLIAQTTKIFFGKHVFPSLMRWRTSLKMARKGEIPIPPATKIKFSYLT